MININVNTVLLATFAIFLGGCATFASEPTTNTAASASDSNVELQTAQRRVSELESELAASDRSLKDAEAKMNSSQDARVPSSLFPPNPKVGECYARVLIPARYETVSEQVVRSEASERYEIIPARYETVEEQILAKEASTRLEVFPAEYETVEEQMLVKAASTRIVETPAEYETISEQVLDKPAHTIWKKGPAALQSATVVSERTTDTGEVMCLVEVPASYKTVTKRVIRRPASTQVVNIPAEYKTVSKRVVKTPATTREVTIPAQYETIQVTRVASAASERRIEIPAEFGSVTRTEKVGEEYVEWRQVVCEVNLTHSNVVELQTALADKGYYKAGIDGVIGSETLRAAKDYALANGLPAGNNYVAVDVVEALALDIQ